MDEEKPYWLFLDSEDELSWELFNYFPRQHFRAAIRQYKNRVDVIKQ